MSVTPYMYVFDASGLTDGVSYARRHIDLRADGDSFRLRRIAALNTVASTMSLYRDASNKVFTDSRLGNHYLVRPELVFDGRDSILFDLGTVTRAFNACALPIYTSQIVFQGTRRGRDREFAGWRDRRPYTLPYTLTVDWYRYASLVTGVVNPARRFRIPIENYDFELHRIRIRNSDGSAVAANHFAVQLYDAFGNALSDAPVLQSCLNQLSSGYDSVFPDPPVIYPSRTDLVMDVTSLICNTDGTFPKVYSITFEGVRRLP